MSNSNLGKNRRHLTAGCIYLDVTLQLVYLHREVGMVGVVLGHIAASLVQHGEQRAEAAQAGEVHNVLQLESVFKCLGYQAVGCEIRLHYCCSISLNLLGETNTAQSICFSFDYQAERNGFVLRFEMLNI